MLLESLLESQGKCEGVLQECHTYMCVHPSVFQIGLDRIVILYMCVHLSVSQTGLDRIVILYMCVSIRPSLRLDWIGVSFV